MLERRDSVAGEVQLCQGGEEPSGEGRDGREGVAVEGQDGETVQAGQCARRNLGDKVEAHVSLLHRQGERGMEGSLSLLPGEGWGLSVPRLSRWKESGMYSMEFSHSRTSVH